MAKKHSHLWVWEFIYKVFVLIVIKIVSRVGLEIYLGVFYKIFIFIVIKNNPTCGFENFTVKIRNLFSVVGLFISNHSYGKNAD